MSGLGATTEDRYEDMGATGIPDQSQGSDSHARGNERFALVLEIAGTLTSHRPSRFVAALLVLCAAIASVAALTYFGARTFTSRAAEERAAAESMSFATHSSLLATGDAFSGYVQILRYSEDPVVRTQAAEPQQRRDAMQQLLWLNTNRMSSLAVVDRSGLVLLSTDGQVRNVKASAAFNTSRANLGPANSDIIVSDDGATSYVEFAAPLREADGAVWGFLYARADPGQLWRDTLNATIDGGHNVIINSEGRFAAGVPSAQIGQPWRGAPYANGSVRADIAGTDSICGLGAIGKDTQIDHGWFVASCLPVSLISIESQRALGNQGLVTIAGAVLAAVIAAAYLKVILRGPTVDAPAIESEASASEETGPDDLTTPVLQGSLDDAPAVERREPTPAVEPVVEDARPAPIVVMADVDALRLIEAYERRNARLSEELRETIQARLMIAATQAEEAYRIAAADPERAAELHREAIEEIESVRERELRGIGQELHPSLVRLGLPGALRSMQKEFAGRIDLRLSIDANVDSTSSRGGRITIDPRLRLALYRIVRDAARALIDAGATFADIALTRDSLEVTLAVSGDATGAFAASDTLPADELAVAAFGGTLTDEGAAIVTRVLAPHVEQIEPELAELSDDELDPPASESIRRNATEVDLRDGELARESALEPLDGDAAPLEQPTRTLPPTAVTFTLPEEDELLPVSEPTETPEDDVDLPLVVQITALSEVIPSAADDEATEDLLAADDDEANETTITSEDEATNTTDANAA